MLRSLGWTRTVRQCLPGSTGPALTSTAVTQTRPPWLAHFSEALRCTAARYAASDSPAEACILAPEAGVEQALKAAAQALGRQPGPREQELAAKLQSNWYTTAADVAAMSQEEVRLLGVPVRLWAAIQQAVQQQQQHGSSSGAHTQQQPTVPPASSQERGGKAAELENPAVSKQQQQQEAGLLEGPPRPSWVDLPADIMQRRMPAYAERPPAAAAAVAIGAKGGAAAVAGSPAMPHVRRVPLRDTSPYALKAQDTPEQLAAEFSALEFFCTGTFYGQRVAPIRAISYENYERALRGMLGWQARVKGVPLEQLSLKDLLPSPGREAVSQLLEYQQFRSSRGCNDASHKMTIKACVHLARFLYHDISQVTQPGPSGGRAAGSQVPYRDLPVIQELARLMSLAGKGVQRAPPVADESKKWLEWEEFLGVVRQLRAEVAGMTPAGKPRQRREVAKSLQTYLIFAILSVVPDRQRTLRELELGRTLVKEGDRWMIRHGPDDYKTGKQYGERPPLVIAPFIYPELEAFIDTWRQELQPATARLFCKPKTGQPMDDTSVYTCFKKAALRLTGKATNPHLVRDMIVTHLRSQGASESDMEALALYMGHSIQMQRNTYDRRTQAQKVTPAVQLLQELAATRGRGGKTAASSKAR